MIKKLEGKRPYITPLTTSFKECRVGAFDTETYEHNKKGFINTIQFCGDDHPATIDYVDNDSALSTFMELLDAWCKRGIVNVVFAHNLGYDLQAILLGEEQYQEALANGELHLTWGFCQFHIYYGKVCFCRITWGEHRSCLLIDSFRFSFASLEKTAILFGVKSRKLNKPIGLGNRRFYKGCQGVNEFESYGKEDVIVLHEIGQVIVDIHKHFDVPICVSSAQLASKVFRKQYLSTPFAPLPRIFESWAVDSFHGGITRAIAGFYDELTEFDISSAYPEAMNNLGVPESYNLVNEFSGENGIYLIEGSCNDVNYPILFDASFNTANKVSLYCCDGYSLKSAMDYGEFNGKVIKGYTISFNQDPAFQKFVRFFYSAKDEAKKSGDQVKAHFYKRILNSLYGKFVQTTEEEGYFRPSGLFSPAIASLITGYVRAKIHNVEHISHSVHTATDAVKCHKSSIETGEGLGAFTREATGACLIVRGKVYAHYDNASTKWKLASHGLGVNPPEKAWKQILEFGKTSKKRVVTPKTARSRHLNPLTWIEVEAVLRNPIPAMPKIFEEALRDHVSTY